MDYTMNGVYTTALLYLVYTDLRERRIPNRVVIPAAAIALLDSCLRGTWRSDLPSGVLAATLFLLPIFIYGPEKSGAGDVKLALFIGIWGGYPAIVGAILIAALSISILALVTWICGRFDRKATVPMAPFLALGTITMLILY